MIEETTRGKRTPRIAWLLSAATVAAVGLAGCAYPRHGPPLPPGPPFVERRVYYDGYPARHYRYTNRHYGPPYRHHREPPRRSRYDRYDHYDRDRHDGDHDHDSWPPPPPLPPLPPWVGHR